jgi:hypothetical protein
MSLLPRRWVFVLAATAALLVPCGSALAWGPHGHRIATRIAEARLSPEARAAVHELLHEGDTLLNICTWADEDGHTAVPGSAPWHYVNVPIDAPKYSDRYCRRGDCVVAKIQQFRKVLADRRAPKAERTRALLFFVHFVEDVHQPLHVGDHNDKGGNETQIQYFNEGVNLHRLWDSTMINDASRDEREWVQRIEPLLTEATLGAWTKGTVESWADESLAEAKKAYRDPRNPARTIATGDRLGREYAELGVPVIRLRLAQAGVRLAHELNAIFADDGAAPVKAKAKETRKPAPVPLPAGRR